MSHTHTPVSASVIKSTSRFAPKAVPRKKPSAAVPPPRPTTIEEASESEDEIEEVARIDSLHENEIPTVSRKVTEGIPTIQSSIPQSKGTPIETITSPPPTVSQSTRTLRSSGPVSERVQATAAPTSEVVPSTTSTSRKRRQTTTPKDDSNRRRRRRKTTPPTAEEVVISSATMTMSEMCVDRRTGRKSGRYAELQEAERQRKKLREIKREQRTSGSQDVTNQMPSESIPLESGAAVATEEELEEEDDTLLPVASGTARVMTDSSGNIVLDQSSLQVDRHAVHPSTLTDSLIHTTETVFSSKTNSATYPSTRTHASNTVRWLPSDNERFYEALRMFGTNFQMVALYLGGGKTRRHVKNKFDREEKLNPDKLTWALKNELPPDIEGLEEKRGQKMRKYEEIKPDLDEIRREAEAVKALPPVSQSQPATGDRSEKH